MSAAAPVLVCDSSNRPAWLESRKKGIGSSDSPCILRLEKAWGNPFVVSCIKRGLTLPDDAPDQESELMKWGHYVEGPLLQAFEEETGHTAQLSGLMYRSGNPDTPYAMTTQDGVVHEKGGKVGGAECKLAIYTSKDWERYGIPEHVACQNLHTMDVMDWDFVYTLALLDGYRFRWKKQERDDEILGDIIRPAEAEFWRRLQDGEQFDAGVGGRPGMSADWLKSLHPNDNGETALLKGDHWMDVMDRWRLAADEEKAAKERKEKAKNSLVQEVGDATFGRLDDGRRVSLKTQTRTTKPTTATKTSTFRVLRETG